MTRRSRRVAPTQADLAEATRRLLSTLTERAAASTLDVQHMPGAESAKRALEVTATGRRRITLPGEIP